MFFSKVFKKLKTTRSFKKYMLDQFLINNFLHKTFWNIDEIFNICNKNNLRFYSSYPNYNTLECGWHKDVKSNKKFNKNILENYSTIEHSFIDKNFQFTQSDVKIVKIMLNLMINSCQTNQFEKNIKKMLKIKIPKNNKNKFFKYLRKLLLNINYGNYKKFSDKTTWGFPNHYIVFRKTK